MLAVDTSPSLALGVLPHRFDLLGCGNLGCGLCSKLGHLLGAQGLFASSLANLLLHGLVAVNDVGLTVEEGQIYSLIGPNGAGKTTLFNLISAGFRPTSGRILFQGQDLTRLAAKVLRIDVDAGNLLDVRYRLHGSGIDSPGRGVTATLTGEW